MKKLLRVVIFGLLVGWLAGCIRPEQPAVITPSPATGGVALCNPDDLHQCLLSPDGRWAAELNEAKGSLLLNTFDWRVQELFPDGDSINAAVWSPDSRNLIIARLNYHWTDNSGNIKVEGPPQLWQVTIDGNTFTTPTLVYEAPRILPVFGDMGPGEITLGEWSPDGRHLLFWVGPLGASMQADGLPFLTLDLTTQQATLLADSALLNPHYHSWSPDGSALAYTAGGYRSAQVNKWLNIWDSNTGEITTAISQTEQIPGIIAWSPSGDWIAYAAVPAAETSAELADWGSFDNPAIAGRRIYLLNPATAETQRLNDADALQDAPTWSEDGATLYYVQRDGVEVVLMAADPATGQAATIEASRQPLPDYIGYYGQGEWDKWLAYRPRKAASTGATLTGQIVAGYGDHQPLATLPLWVGTDATGVATGATDGNGNFVLTGLPVGTVRVVTSHLAFTATMPTATATVDLGVLNYPLIHPPDNLWYTTPPIDLVATRQQAQSIPYTLCAEDVSWTRPSQEQQQQVVWSQAPFRQASKAWLTQWFAQFAVLYDTQDRFVQSGPDGVRLDKLATDWRYLLGLWNADNWLDNSPCAYDGVALNALLTRSQLEVWLLGYRVDRVEQVGKREVVYKEKRMCDPQARACQQRPGVHFFIQVTPAPGFQIVRFAGGIADVIAIHLLDATGQALLELP